MLEFSVQIIFSILVLCDHKDFYGKRGSYNVFAGKDCTRAVAKWSKNPEDMIPDLVF